MKTVSDILLCTNPYADRKSVAFQLVAQVLQGKMVRPRSMSVLLGCTITNWNALITTVYVWQVHCQHAQMFLSLSHSTERHEPPTVPTCIYTGCYTDCVQTLLTTISCPLLQSNGSLTCPFAGRVTAGVHNEGYIYLFPFAIRGHLIPIHQVLGQLYLTLPYQPLMTRMTARAPE